MWGLWLRLLRGGGKSVRLEIGLPLVAGLIITFILLLLLGLQQGMDQRANRTAWRTPEAATSEPTAIQAGYIDYTAEHPITVVELAALTHNPPPMPGINKFPKPGEVWVSPALARLMAELPADQLAERFPGPVTAELAPNLLESPDELVAVIGRSPTDQAMTGERPKHQWNAAASLTPTKINYWSTTPDLYQTTYRDIALLVVVLTVLPLISLGGLTSRLMAGRRQRRIAILRLLGASTAQVAKLTIAELAVFATAGAVCGALLYKLFLPLASGVPVKGGEWFATDLQIGLLPILITVAAVVATLTIGALAGLVPAVREPLAAYRAARRKAPRLWWANILFIVAIVVLFSLRSSNPFVTVAFTVVVILGWGILSTGPWIVKCIGKLLARRSRHVATFLAGRRLSDNPRSAWRTVGGMTLAAFIAGFTAAGIPAGLGNAGDYASRAERLDMVLPAATLDSTAQKADAILQADNIKADIETSAAPEWLDKDKWGTLTLVSHGTESAMDRARTTLTEHKLWGPELRLSDDIPVVWLLRDGITISMLILPTAALVAFTSMLIGAIARIYDQRESLIALTLAGTPQSVLLAAQRQEMILPTIFLGSIAALAGLVAGSTLGLVNLLNPYTIGIFVGLLALGVLALLFADRTARPILERVSTDLSERE